MDEGDKAQDGENEKNSEKEQDSEVSEDTKSGNLRKLWTLLCKPVKALEKCRQLNCVEIFPHLFCVS